MNKNYKKYGDVWIHHKAFDKLKKVEEEQAAKIIIA